MSVEAKPSGDAMRAVRHTEVKPLREDRSSPADAFAQEHECASPLHGRLSEHTDDTRTDRQLRHTHKPLPHHIAMALNKMHEDGQALSRCRCTARNGRAKVESAFAQGRPSRTHDKSSPDATPTGRTAL